MYERGWWGAGEGRGRVGSRVGGEGTEILGICLI